MFRKGGGVVSFSFLFLPHLLACRIFSFLTKDRILGLGSESPNGVGLRENGRKEGQAGKNGQLSELSWIEL